LPAIDEKTTIVSIRGEIMFVKDKKTGLLKPGPIKINDGKKFAKQIEKMKNKKVDFSDLFAK
jgi:hypothetical protein